MAALAMHQGQLFHRQLPWAQQQRYREHLWQRTALAQPLRRSDGPLRDDHKHVGATAWLVPPTVSLAPLPAPQREPQLAPRPVFERAPPVPGATEMCSDDDDDVCLDAADLPEFDGDLAEVFDVW